MVSYFAINCLEKKKQICSCDVLKPLEKCNQFFFKWIDNLNNI